MVFFFYIAPPKNCCGMCIAPPKQEKSSFPVQLPELTALFPKNNVRRIKASPRNAGWKSKVSKSYDYHGLKNTDSQGCLAGEKLQSKNGTAEGKRGTLTHKCANLFPIPIQTQNILGRRLWVLDLLFVTLAARSRNAGEILSLRNTEKPLRRGGREKLQRRKGWARRK